MGTAYGGRWRLLCTSFLRFNETNKESEFSAQQVIFSLEFASNLLMYCLAF